MFNVIGGATEYDEERPRRVLGAETKNRGIGLGQTARNAYLE